MNRTTVVADETLLVQVRSLARRRKVSFSEVVRCALAEYVSRAGPAGRKPSFLGAASSGGKLRLSERAEDLLFQKPRRAK